MYWIQLYVTDGRSWFFPGTPVSSTNNTERHDITEILLKVTLNTKYRQRKKRKIHHRRTLSLFDDYNIS
jgi:hypothetical protein